MANSDFASVALQDAGDILYELYMPGFNDQTFTAGLITNRFIQPSKRRVDADGINIKFEIARGDSVRASTSPLGDFARSRAYTPQELKVRFDTVASANDFTEFSGSATISMLDVMQKGRGGAVDHARKVYDELVKDFGEKIALKRNTPKSGLVALVSGTPTLATDQFYYLSTAGAATNAAGANLQIDGGPIGAFQPGRRYDFWSTSLSAMVATNVRCVYRNTSDNSVRFAFVSTGQDQSTGNLANIADNNEIYLSGEKGMGLHSLVSWFTRPTSTDSFIGGVDRLDDDNMYLLTQATRDGISTNSKIQKSHFNDLANAMNFNIEDGQTVAIRSDPLLNQAIRDEIGEEAFIQYPTGSDKQKRFAHFGSIGVTYQHPQFGVVTFVSDPLMIPNTIQLLDMDDWEGLFYGDSQPQFLPGEMGPFRIMASDTAGGGDSKFVKASAWIPGLCDFCMRPNRQGQILAVSAT